MRRRRRRWRIVAALLSATIAIGACGAPGTATGSAPGSDQPANGASAIVVPHRRPPVGTFVSLVPACRARGMDTRRLARELFVSQNTVQDHFKSIVAKTRTRTRGELLAIARGG